MILAGVRIVGHKMMAFLFLRPPNRWGRRHCVFELFARLCMRAYVRYDTRCYFNVRSKADISQLNLPHGTDN